MLKGREVSGEVSARVLARMRRGKEITLALLTISTLVRTVGPFSCSVEQPFREEKALMWDIDDR